MSIRICVVLGQALRPGPGERRFISALTGDPRFELTALTTAPAVAERVPSGVQRLIDIEQLAFKVPDTAPKEIPPVAPFDPQALSDCDVIVDFSHSGAVLDLAARARHGLWRLSAFEPGAGFAEARDRAPVTEVQLVSHGAGGSVETLSTAAYDTKFLASRNRAFIREKSVQMVLQALARLVATGSAVAGIDGPLPVRRGADVFRAHDVPVYLGRTVQELVRRALFAAGERLGRRPGMFSLRLGTGDRLRFDPGSATDLVPQNNEFWADPFLFEHEGALYLFYETYDYRTRLGHLSVGRVEGDRLVPLGDALKRPYHLSFPFVLSHGDEILMIPETHETKRTEVWRATTFPTEWELAATAFQGVATADTVVFQHQGRWWLFTNICNDSFNDFGSELHLFMIDGPMLNEVVPHPLNPVVIDTRTARGGGRVFCENGRLYRTSQDNSHGVYGYGLNVMEITRLDETGYQETRLRHVLPDFTDGIMACHHMDAAAGRFVIDVRRRALGGPDLWRR